MAGYDVIHSVDKFTASQTVRLRGVDQFIHLKKEQSYPTFHSSDDPSGVGFNLILSFGGKVENFISLDLVTDSKEKDGIFIYEACFTMTDRDKKNLKRVNFTCKLLTKTGVRCSYCLKDTAVDTTSKDNLILTCKFTYGPNDSNVVQKSKLCKPDYTDFFLWTYNKFSRDMKSLFQSGDDADVTFNVGGEKLKAHKLILITRSEYFNKMFKADMKEASSNEVDIPDVEASVFQIFLKFLYTSSISENLEYNLASSLLSLADRYDEDHLKVLCEVALSNALVIDNVVETVILADLHSAASLKKDGFDFVKENFVEVLASEKWELMKEHPLLLMEFVRSQGKDRRCHFSPKQPPPVKDSLFSDIFIAFFLVGLFCVFCTQLIWFYARLR